MTSVEKVFSCAKIGAQIRKRRRREIGVLDIPIDSSIAAGPDVGRDQKVMRALNCSLRGWLDMDEKIPKVAESMFVPGAAK